MQGVYSDNGYIGIDEAKHKVYKYTVSTGDLLPATYTMQIGSNDICFATSETIKEKCIIEYSTFDAASRKYVAVVNSYGVLQSIIPAYVSESGIALSPIEEEERENVLSSVIDYSYFESLGMIKNAHTIAVGEYQRNTVYTRNQLLFLRAAMADYRLRIAELVGATDYCVCHVDVPQEDRVIEILDRAETNEEKKIEVGDRVTVVYVYTSEYKTATVASIDGNTLTTEEDVFTTDEEIYCVIVSHGQPNGIIGGKESAVEAAELQIEDITDASVYYQTSTPNGENGDYWYNPSVMELKKYIDGWTEPEEDDEDAGLIKSCCIRKNQLLEGLYPSYTYEAELNMNPGKYAFEIMGRLYVFELKEEAAAGTTFTYERDEGIVKMVVGEEETQLAVSIAEAGLFEDD